MAETEQYPASAGKRAPGSVYTTQPKPYLRNAAAKDGWDKVSRENKIMAGKLHEIRREPPATFLAPNGHASLKRGPAPGSKPQSTMPNTITHVDVVVWPPKRCQTAPITRARSQSRIQQENKYLAAKLVELYTSQRPRDQVNPGGVYHHSDSTGASTRPDCLAQWPLRTQMYYPDDSTQQHLTTAVGAEAEAQGRVEAGQEGPSGVGAQAHDAMQQDVAGPQGQSSTTSAAAAATAGAGAGAGEDPSDPLPLPVCPLPIPQLVELPRCKHSACKHQNGRQLHAIGFVRCAGCHVVYNFDQADRPAPAGKRMKMCSCKQVYYCSQLCARMDWISHKAVHNWHTAGHATTFGKKPEEEHWVVNQAMRKVRQKLRQRGESALAQHAHSTLVPQAQLTTMAGVVSHPSSKGTVRPTSAPSCPFSRGILNSKQGSIGMLGQGQAQGYDEMFEECEKMYEYYRQERVKEKALEAVQKRVEDNAYWGLDGPRPCMYMGGRPV